MTNAIWRKQSNTPKAHKVFHNYAWHAQISNTRCPLWQVSDRPPLPHIMDIKDRLLALSPANHQGSQREKARLSAGKLSKTAWNFWGDEHLIVEVGQWPEVGPAGAPLRDGWQTTQFQCGPSTALRRALTQGSNTAVTTILQTTVPRRSGPWDGDDVLKFSRKACKDN